MTDNSPMLSQASDDNAPMISGRGTRIIADARGAYLAGNLPTLVSQLDEEQQTTFLQSLTQLALLYAQRAFDLLPPNARERAEYEEAKARLLQTEMPLQLHGAHFSWRDDDYDWASYNITRVLDALDRLVLNDPGLGLIDIANAAINVVVHAFAANLVLQDKPQSIRDEQRIRWMAGRYAIEAAWSVVGRQKPLSVEDFLDDERQIAYRSADLQSLVQRMTDTQRLTFKQALIHQGVKSAAKVLPQDNTYSAEHQCLAAARQWLDDPSEDNIQTAIRAQKMQMVVPITPVTRRVQREVSSLIDALRINNVARSAELISEIAEHAAEAKEIRSERWHSNVDEVRWWQIEAAWAILHDQEPPPFEVAS